jgi:ubiquinone/menaquinone biosynthesis C-methylase UbiE
MNIDNFSTDLLLKLVCPVSRETLSLRSTDLVTESGYIYPLGDFRVTSQITQNKEWIDGQSHYEKYHDRWMAQTKQYYEAVDSETLDMYSMVPLKGFVLDVGGGFGSVALQAKLDPNQIVCIDPMVCRWSDLPEGAYRDHYSILSSIVRIPGFAEDVPFPNSSVDTVHMRSCLDHFANPHRALLEARRVLKPEGQLVVGLALDGAFKLNQNGMRNLVKRKIKNSIVGDVYEHFFDQHIFHPTEESLRALVCSAGFKIIQWIMQPGYFNVVYLTAIKSSIKE